MDPSELVKHAPELIKSGSELLKGGAAVAGAFKFTEIIKAFLGPATEEIAERFRDEVRLYRFGRQLECLKKAEKMAKDAGFAPKAVPIKLLFPLLDGASLEENEELHTMWAALLANAASPTKGNMVRPGFIAMLKQMAPDEALLLKAIRSMTDEYLSSMPGFTGPTKRAADAAMASRRAYLMLDLQAKFRREGEVDSALSLRFQICAHLLENAGLIVGSDLFTLTTLGGTFVECCEPPKPNS